MKLGHLSAHGRSAVLVACYEYLLVTLPVGLYVTLEAIHRERFLFLVVSPEWAIATIFLAFQGVTLYARNLKAAGRKISWHWVGILSLFALVTIFGASINAFESLGQSTTLSVVVRLSLFSTVSMAFVLLVGGAHLVLLREGEKRGA